jgi:hypothetical protein
LGWGASVGSDDSWVGELQLAVMILWVGSFRIVTNEAHPPWQYKGEIKKFLEINSN